MSRTPTPLLWIVYTCLLSCALSLTSIDKDTLDSKQKEYLAKMEALWGADPVKDQPLFLEELFEGREYIHPDDPNKTVRIHYYNTALGHQYLLDEADKLVEFSAKDVELNGNPRFSQRVHNVFCTFKETTYTLIMELDRFRGNLVELMVIENVLHNQMRNFGIRLQIYSQLAMVMQIYYEMGYKHCALEARRILYKRADDDYNNGLNGNSAIQVVLGDLRYVTPLDTPCTRGFKSTQDHDDALQNIPKTDKCKRKIEMFGLGMLFLEIEVNFLAFEGDSNLADRLPVITAGYKEFPDAPPDLQTLYKRTDPFKGYIIADVFNHIRTIINNWNYSKVTKNKISPSFDSINKDIAYLMRPLSLIYSLIEATRCNEFAKNKAAQKKILGAYENFNTMVLKMLEANDYVNGRPNQEEVSAIVLALMNTYNEGEAMYSRRRLLIV